MSRIQIPLPNSNGDDAVEPSRELRSVDLDGRPSPLIVSVGDEDIEINPWDLREEASHQHYYDQWAAAQTSIDFDIRHLLAWDHVERYDVLLFITGFGRDYGVRDDQEGINSGNLFDVVLSMMVGSENIHQCERGRRAATETAGLQHASELRVACNQILEQLQSLGVRGFRIGQLVEEARAASTIAHGSASETDELIYVADLLPEAPVPDSLVVPPGWQVSAEGICGTSDSNGEPVITTPILIRRRFVDLQTETEHLELIWRRPDGWHRRIVERVKIATTRTIIELAAQGVPVTSNNGDKYVQFLADFEAFNIERLPCEQVSGQLGWQSAGGHPSFLWGQLQITETAQTVADTTEQGDSTPVTRPEITFRGADEGDNQLASGFHAHGTFEQWREAISVLGEFPRVRLAIYAALSTILLRIVGAANFVLSYSSPTSQGKTTALRVAASCWGCPDERSPQAAIGTWDATRVWTERAATVLCDHPLVLDDTKLASRPESISQILYDISSGRARGRGSIEGLRGTATFRTVLIASGEAPITSFSNDAGTRARVLELWGFPFGRADASTGTIVTNLNAGIMAHYGHAGPMLVQFLLDNYDQRETWCQDYRQHLQQYTERAGDNSVGVRLAGYFAVLQLAVQLSCQAGIVPCEADSVVSDLWPALGC